VYLAGRDLMSIVDANAPASIAKPQTRTVEEADATRPLVPAPGGYRKVVTLGNEGRSWYRGLQVKVDRTVGSLLLLSSYTLSRARDMANYLLPEDSRNIEAETGRSDNDVRHNVTAGLTWQIPSKGAAFGGWTLSAAAQFRSSRPYNITWGDDRNGTTQNDARPDGRNTGTTDTYRNVDVALARRFAFSTRTLELRAEAFNIVSTTNYDEYVGALSSPCTARLSVPSRSAAFNSRRWSGSDDIVLRSQVRPARAGAGSGSRRVPCRRSVQRRKRRHRVADGSDGPGSIEPQSQPDAKRTGDLRRRRRHRDLRRQRGRDRPSDRRHRRHRVHAGRQRLLLRDTCGLPELLRADMGPLQVPHAAVAGQPRLRHAGSHALLRVLRRQCRPVRPGLLQLRPRCVAHPLAEQQRGH
jgi:hypothetical protein